MSKQNLNAKASLRGSDGLDIGDFTETWAGAGGFRPPKGHQGLSRVMMW